MYHIGRDKRKIQSAELICRGLEELMLKKKYESLSITEIALHSGIGRATFYRLFDDKADVIMYRMETVFNEILAKNMPGDGKVKNADAILASMFRFWLKRKSLLLALIKANLYSDFQARLSVFIEEKLSFIKDEIHLDEKNWKYFINIRSAMLFAALKVAATHYGEDTPEDIVNTLHFLFGSQETILNRSALKKRRGTRQMRKEVIA